MSRTWTKSERDPWPVPGDDDTIILASGTHGAAEFSACRDLTIEGQPGAVVEGSLTPRGGEPSCSLRFHDGCDRLKIIGLEVRKSAGRGIRITGAALVMIKDVVSHSHSIEAIILGNCPGASILGVTCHSSQKPAHGYTADQLHGVYLSGNADNSLIDGLTAYDLSGSALQINGYGIDQQIAHKVHASRMDFQRCGTRTTPPISLMATQESTFELFRISDCPAGWWVVLFDDGGGEEFACSGNTFLTYTAAGVIHEEAGSARNVFRPGVGWEPGDMPTPSPEPTPHPTPAPNLLAQAIANMDRTLAAKRLVRKNVLASWAQVKAALK